ncbi:helix-turn-helix transcriptional regulator [Polaribacter sp. R2A056_3_33]|uniref:AraC family transcriptional regulator n=1 Tax=unclassified Polaribacter TaxID=196858 RepID=UPI001C4E82E8|nr:MULTISPECIES: AraC family transcriptional regulator [unclassified Polaribacter]QXP65217.1 helix-turn-helix transcriptional regulator [Polaribacter sp. HaHaR_3_91]QXP69870.1 helix-turn-helix transcriptional regulator [Polaribacter sp. R2A056_3_33]
MHSIGFWNNSHTMHFVFEKIFVPSNHTFISRELPLSPNKKIHSHKNFEINYVTSGKGRRIIGDHISNFEKGDLVLIGSDLPHCWDLQNSDHNESPTCIVTHFSENVFNFDFFKIPELKQVELLLKEASNGIRFKVKDDVEIHKTLIEMVKTDGLEYYIKLLKLFEYLIKIEDREQLSNPTNKKTAFSKNVDKIDKVYEYVFLNIKEGINLDEASAVLNMAPSSFCRFFKKKTGLTFMEYVKNVKVGIATKLLAETDKQIAEICYESGYNNLANFNLYFKAKMGKTPSNYRKYFRH